MSLLHRLEKTAPWTTAAELRRRATVLRLVAWQQAAAPDAHDKGSYAHGAQIGLLTAQSIMDGHGVILDKKKVRPSAYPVIRSAFYLGLLLGMGIVWILK